MSEQSKSSSPTTPQKGYYERVNQMEFDFHKHLTTLSSGAVVILAVFLGRAALGVNWLLATATVFLLISTILSACAMYSVVLEDYRRGFVRADEDEREFRPFVKPFTWLIPDFLAVSYAVKLCALVTFVVGVFFLACFVFVSSLFPTL